MDLCARSSAIAPSQHLPNRLGLALENHLHPAILCVPDPTTQFELVRAALQRIRESYVLHNTAGDQDVRP